MFPSSHGGDDRCLSQQDSRGSRPRNNFQRFKSVWTLRLAQLSLAQYSETKHIFCLINCLSSRNTQTDKVKLKYSKILIEARGGGLDGCPCSFQHLVAAGASV